MLLTGFKMKEIIINAPVSGANQFTFKQPDRLIEIFS